MLDQFAVAAITHEANRMLCLSHGDTSQVNWMEAPEWQRKSAIQGVLFTLDHRDATPADNHANWWNQKLEDGWTYGPVKDPDKKEHPCMVPYDTLPREQQAKDHLFRSIVLALAPFVCINLAAE